MYALNLNRDRYYYFWCDDMLLVSLMNTLPSLTQESLSKDIRSEPQWKSLRCGSVLTAKVGVRSIYGIVGKFLRAGCTTVRREDFDLVKWFQPPEYPIPV